MTDSKLRIPRVALAVLVLGAACGDDEKGNSDGSRDAGSGGHDDHDGGHDEHDAGDDHQAHDAAGDDDAGADHEPGDGGHEEHDGGSVADGGVDDVLDISEARIQQVADDFCAQGFRCDVEEVAGNFEDQAACVADSVSYWESYIETLGEDCIDAQLDLYACAALLSCSEDIEHECHALIQTTGELCASEG